MIEDRRMIYSMYGGREYTIGAPGKRQLVGLLQIAVLGAKKPGMYWLRDEMQVGGNMF